MNVQKKQRVQGSVLSAFSGIYWGFWNVSPRIWRDYYMYMYIYVYVSSVCVYITHIKGNYCA